MNAKDALMSNAKLIQAIAEACVLALKAGLSRDDVMAALARASELIEASEEE
jgi:3-hydroxyisobutyrate dehydrogenase-like beta-hydroxyacid dehydrogenase